MRGGDRGKVTRSVVTATSERDILEDARLVKEVRELRRLVPATRDLFRDAATYIEDLQVQVQLMRMLLEKLSDE